MDPIYNRAVERIRRQGRSSSDLAFNILSWLVKARRALTVEELRVGISVEPGRYELEELDLPDRSTLIDICASLVSIDEQSNTISLTHYTVKEYLLENPIIPADAADLSIAMACTTYLSFHTLVDPCVSHEAMGDRLYSHPFLSYAAHQLISHLSDCDENATIDMSSTSYSV